MSSGLFKVIANFEDKDGQPLTGPAYTVRLYDRDRFFDDKLGKATLESDGSASFLIAVAVIMSCDSPGERTPDIYFVLEKDGEEIFRSEVIENVDFEAVDPVTERPEGLTKSFGPFRITDS